MKKVVAVLTLCGAMTASAVVYRPGLIQAKYTYAEGGKANASAEAPMLTNFPTVFSAARLDRTLDTMMANHRANGSGEPGKVNPLSGIEWKWAGWTVFGYEGEIWLDAAQEYECFMQGDDGAAIVIGGETVVTAGNASSWQAGKTASFRPERTGWHRFHAYAWDWNGNKGPSDGCLGLAWNTNGVTSSSTVSTNDTAWQLFSDPGTMSRLRTATREASSLVIGGVSYENNVYTVRVTPNTASAGTVTVFLGPQSAVAGDPADWDISALVSYTDGAAEQTVAVTRGGAEDPLFAAVRVTSSDISGLYEMWSEPMSLVLGPTVSLDLTRVFYTFATFDAAVLLAGLNAETARATLFVSRDAAGTDIVCQNEASEALASFPARLPAFRVDGLTPNRIYYAKLSAVNNLGVMGETDWVAFTTMDPDVSDLNDVILDVGEEVLLPVLGENEFFAYDTNALISVAADFSSFTALEPGANLIRHCRFDPAGGTNIVLATGVATIVPQPVGSGKVYVCTASGSFTWADPINWRCVTDDEGPYPNGVDDIAILARAPTGNPTIAMPEGDVALGGLYVANLQYPSSERWFTLSGNGKLVFHSSSQDGAWLRVNGRDGNRANVKMTLTVALASDLVLDYMNGYSGNCWFTRDLDIGSHTFRTARCLLAGMPGADGYVRFDGDVAGTGKLDLAAEIAAGASHSPISPFKTFSGSIDARHCPYSSYFGGCALNFGNLAFSGAEKITVEGAWYADKNRGAHVRVGWGNKDQYRAWTNEYLNPLPRNVELRGGQLNLSLQGPLSDAAATNGLQTGVMRNLHTFDTFRVSGPMGLLRCNPEDAWNTAHYFPDVIVEIGNWIFDPGSTLALSWTKGSTTATQGVRLNCPSNTVLLLNIPDYGHQDPAGDYLYPNVLASINVGDPNKLVFRAKTAHDGYLAGEVYLGDPDSTANSSGNYRRFPNNGEVLSAGAVYTSMQVVSGRKIRFPAPGSVVTNQSGFLALGDSHAAMGELGHANSASSSVDFMDNPAYVYACRQGHTVDIGCKLATTGGLVKSGPGTLLLAADSSQTLSGGVVVNCGTLQLGSADGTYSGHIGKNDVRIDAGAALEVNTANAWAQTVVLTMEDMAWIDAYARIVLNVNAKVDRLYINGEPMPRGAYGASATGAEFIDSAHFSGTGVLTVTHDNSHPGTVVLLF